MKKDIVIIPAYGLRILAVLFLSVGAIGLSSCKKKGPMEKAGEKVDEAVEDVTN